MPVAKIRKAVHKGILPKKKVSQLIEMAAEKGVITAEEKRDLIRAEELRNDAIQVDDFSQDDYLNIHNKDSKKENPVFGQGLKQNMRVI